jgi:hypothetical protein
MADQQMPDLPLHEATLTNTLPADMLESMLAGLEIYFAREPTLLEHFGRCSELHDPLRLPPELEEMIQCIKGIREQLPVTQHIARALYLAMAALFPSIRMHIDEGHPTHPMAPSRKGGQKFFSDLTFIVHSQLVAGAGGMTSRDFLDASLRAYTLTHKSLGLDAIWQ